MAESSRPLAAQGQLIAGRYVVEEVLGLGGMATVYRVLDRDTDTRCALKRARGDASRSGKRREQLLEREYHTLSQLAHPRIIAVYDFGRDADGPFYTMELLDGSDLAGLGRVPWQRACALLRDVASSLAVLHSRGLLHRDISLRNVRCDAAGRAKLIDFGALSSIGVDLDVVGTAPFVAPEALQMQALDARADVFSLGALGYHLLTGRHAYPARQLRELRDAWRSSPAAASKLVPGLPAALNELIMELLALDRSARPHSAAEIMKRLCTLAQLPIDEDVAVSRAYLAAPALVGREHALITVRRQLLSLARGDGHTLLIKGVQGSGRSRMLDAAVLDGKLLGALVIRGHAAVGAEGEWAIARSLTSQLMAAVPDNVHEAARLHREVLCHVVEGLTDAEPQGPPPERSLLIRQLRDFILTLAHGQRLLIAVDDVESIDEPSLALLAALAHKTERQPLVLVLAAEQQDVPPASASLRLLHSLAIPIEVEPFTASQTEALLRSVFGDVANLPLVAAQVHRLAQGNARDTMELAEHLVARGLCRYEGGSWLLPASIRSDDLPSSLAATLKARLQGLSPDARVLSDIAAICEGPALTTEQFAALSGGWPSRRVFIALHELIAARVLVTDTDFYRFSQHGFVTVARVLMEPAWRATVHGRMADLLQAQAADAILLAHHLLEAAREREAIVVLLGLDPRTRLTPRALLMRALAYAERERMPARLVSELRLSLLTASVFALDVETFRVVSRPTLERLMVDSGLAAYQRLSELPPGERLTRALQQTQAAYIASPEESRSYPVEEGIAKLARLSNAFTVMGLWTGELAMLESFPNLEPLVPLSAAIGVMNGLVLGAKHWQVGRFWCAISTYEDVLARLELPDRSGLDPTQQTLVRSVCLILLGTLEAPAGIPRCDQRAAQLEGDRAFRVTAWRIRQLFHLSQGDTENARRCMRRAELLQLQDGLEQQAHGGAEGVAMIAYVRAEDLLGIEAALADVAPLAARLLYWQPMQSYGQSARLRLQGDPQAALAALLPAFEVSRPLEHWLFGPLAAAHVQLLAELGRLDEAIERGQHYLALAEREQLVSLYEVGRPLGLALMRAGRGVEGLHVVERWIADQVEHEQSGIALGAAYEAAARICLSLEDRAGFDRFAESCARAYAPGNNHVLNAKLARLRVEADPSPEVAPASVPPQGDATQTDGYNTMYSRMRECVDAHDRARCALTLLMQQTDRFAGYLFGCSPEGKAELLAGLPGEPEPQLSAWADAWLQAERANSAAVTEATTASSRDLAEMELLLTSDDELRKLVPNRYRDRDNQNFEALPITVPRDGTELLVAMLVLRVEGATRTIPSRALTGQLASVMLAHGDLSEMWEAGGVPL